MKLGGEAWRRVGVAGGLEDRMVWVCGGRLWSGLGSSSAFGGHLVEVIKLGFGGMTG